VSSKKASHRVPVQILEGHERRVRCVRFCPDEDKLVTGSEDETLRVWNRTTGAVEVLRGHSGSVREVDVSRDGKMIVSGSEDKTVRIWNRESGETMRVCEGHEKEVQSVQFSPDSSRVVSGSFDSTVRVWSVETGELAFEPIECDGDVFCVRYSPSGDRIASGADTVQIWNAETGSGILSIRNSSVYSVAWTADGTHVIGGREGEVTIWDSHTGEQLRTWKAHDDDWIKLSFSPSGSHLATSDWNHNTAFVFDISTGEQITAFKHSTNVNGIAYSPSGNKLFSASYDRTIRCWNTETGGSIGKPWKSHTDHVTCLSLSPDGTKLASASSDETVRFWDARSGEPIDHPLQHEHDLWTVTFSPSGEFVVCGGLNKNVSLWRVPCGELAHSPINLKGHENDVNCVLWSLDGSRLFSASDDRTIRCWNPETGRSIGEPWMGHTHRVISLALSPDGAKLASTSLDDTIRFWDVRSGHPIGHLLLHESYQYTAAF
ncbi:hypothetical protein PAXINDRAFT_49270, partial [Paxillus involutus ATCC 200175]